MQRILSSILTVFYIGVFLISPIVLAQDAGGDANSPLFELILPTSAIANEAFSVTVKAKNTDGTINTAYVGSIVFSVTPSGSGATIPANVDEADSVEYTFTATEKGEHTFPTFLFPKKGTYEITVSNYDDAAYEEVTESITITENGSTTVQNAQVTISEPVAQDTVNAANVIVSGTTSPTSTVNFFVNGQKQSTTISSTDGWFSGTVSGLAEGNNTIKVEVMDGTGTSMGSSSVIINYSKDTPTIDRLTIREWLQVYAGSTVNLEAIGDPGLKMVTVQFGDKPIVLIEDSNRLGTYIGKYQLSNFEGEIKPTVNVESFQGTQASFADLLNINVVASSFENIKVQTTPDKKAEFTFSLKTDLDEIKFFKIKYGTQSGQYDQEVVTNEKAQIKIDNKYTWYVPNIQPGEYYSTIIGLDKDKNELALNSGEQSFVLLNSAEACFIDKVSGVTVKQSGSKSIIYWDKLEDAASYQIFKKDADGEYAMIDEVTDNKYIINIDLSQEEDVFEDFQIRATCKNGDISGEGAYSESISVKTWPAAIALMMLIVASGIAFILMKRGYLS